MKKQSRQQQEDPAARTLKIDGKCKSSKFSPFLLVFSLSLIILSRSNDGVNGAAYYTLENGGSQPGKNSSCHACFDTCDSTDPRDCDCSSSAKTPKNSSSSSSSSSSSTSCTGPFCYVKIEIFPEDGVSSVSKGCVSHSPVVNYGTSGSCHYAGVTDSIACYCLGDLCNGRQRLNGYRPVEAAAAVDSSRQASEEEEEGAVESPRRHVKEVTCCHCDDPLENCTSSSCSNTCRGNYCVYDMISEAQTCGHGHPPSLTHFRADSHTQPWYGDTICSKTVAGSSPLTYGCVCGSDKCNRGPEMIRMEDLSAAEDGYFSQSSIPLSFNNNNPNKNDDNDNSSGIIDRGGNTNNNSGHERHFCYSLVQTSGAKSIAESAYTHAKRCKGNYCFVTLNTRTLALEMTDYLTEDGDPDVSREETLKIIEERAHELTAGCIIATDRDTFQPGCTAEWRQDGGEAISKHCICSGHMCNYFHLISEETAEKWAKMSPHSRQNVSEVRPTAVQLVYGSSSSFQDEQEAGTSLQDIQEIADQRKDDQQQLFESTAEEEVQYVVRNSPTVPGGPNDDQNSLMTKKMTNSSDQAIVVMTSSSLSQFSVQPPCSLLFIRKLILSIVIIIQQMRG